MTIYSILSLLLLAICLRILLWGPGKGSIFWKAACTFVPVCVALGAALSRGGNVWLLFTAVLLCMIADIAIERALLWGVPVFFSAHVFYILWMLSAGAAFGLHLLPAVFACAAILFLYRRPLRQFGIPALFLCAYLLILLIMCFTAINLAVSTRTLTGWLAAAGSIIFVLSDLILGDTLLLGKNGNTRGRLIMSTYELAVFLLAWSGFS